MSHRHVHVYFLKKRFAVEDFHFQYLMSNFRFPMTMMATSMTMSRVRRLAFGQELLEVLLSFCRDERLMSITVMEDYAKTRVVAEA